MVDLYLRGRDVLAAEVIQWSRAARSHETKAWVGSSRRSILESEPEGVDIVEKLTTANLVPVCLGVGSVWLSLV